TSRRTDERARAFEHDCTVITRYETVEGGKPVALDITSVGIEQARRLARVGCEHPVFAGRCARFRNDVESVRIDDQRLTCAQCSLEHLSRPRRAAESGT